MGFIPSRWNTLYNRGILTITLSFDLLSGGGTDDSEKTHSPFNNMPPREGRLTFQTAIPPPLLKFKLNVILRTPQFFTSQ